MALQRELIHVTGADALSYLQGQLSADVLAGPDCRWSLLLEPNGKLGWLLLVKVEADSATLSVEAGQADAVVARLQRFMLRTDAQFVVERVAVRRTRLKGEPAPGSWVHRWCDQDLVDEPQDAADDDGRFEELADAALRVDLGLPANGVELNAELFASSLGSAALSAASSGIKGCYVGQELVARTSSRGTTAPVALVRVNGSGEQPEAGALLCADGGEVGQLTTVAAQPVGWVALARLRRSGLDAALTCEGAPVVAAALS